MKVGEQITVTIGELTVKAKVTSFTHGMSQPDPLPERRSARLPEAAKEYPIRFTLGRRTVHVGETVRVLPSAPCKHDGYIAVVRGVKMNGDGKVAHVDTYPAKRQPAGKVLKGGGYHAYPLARLRAMNQKAEVA